MKLFNNEQNFCIFNHKLLFQKTRDEQNSLLNKIPVTHAILKSKRGEGYMDVAIGILCLMLVVAFAVTLLPVFTAKQQLDIFATEIVRQAEIVGGTNVSSRIDDLKAQTGRNPQIRWNCDYYSGSKVQLNGDIGVTLTDNVDIGFFVFGSFPIEIHAKATGKSEVYYK